MLSHLASAGHVRILIRLALTVVIEKAAHLIHPICPLTINYRKLRITIVEIMSRINKHSYPHHRLATRPEKSFPQNYRISVDNDRRSSMGMMTQRCSLSVFANNYSP